MSGDFVRVENPEEGIRVVTIDRPEKLNVLDTRVLEELEREIPAAESDPALRCLVFTGGGGKAFIVGADIGELAKLTPTEGREHSRRGQTLLDRIEQLPVPTIAAVNGYAYGGGLELAMACTIRVASENARMGLPETSLGIIPGFGGTQRLPRLVGRARALELVVTAEKGLTAAEAERIGLVNRVVPDDELGAVATEWATEIAGNAPLAIRAMKRLFRHGQTQDFASHSHHVLLQTMQLFGTKDFQEGLMSFVEKRPPEFRGR